MYIRITHYWQQSSLATRVVMMIGVFLIAAYPIYTNYYYGYGVEQFQRHREFVEGKSMFFNPWQYRILSPLTVEAVYQLEQTLIEGPLGLEEKVRNSLPLKSSYEHSQVLLDLFQKEGFLTYNTIFILFRLVQHGLIFALMFIYYREFIDNNWLILAGVVFSSFLMANAVNDSDLSFNTYTDIILYLWAGYVISARKNPAMIVLITTLGALNRETSLLIPFLYFVSNIRWDKFDSRRPLSREFLPQAKTFVVAGISTIIFIGIFIAIRAYYGYVPQSYWRADSGLEMVKLNLFSSVSVKSYFEMFGTMVILPLLFLYNFQRQSSSLKIMFLAIVPIWMAVHFWSVVAYQSRLYLVPTLLILLPAFLEIVERYGNPQRKREALT